MALNRYNHANLEEVSQELRHLDANKLDRITFSTQAPTSADKGLFWLQYTANNDTTLTLWVRHPVTGTWRSEAFT